MKWNRWLAALLAAPALVCAVAVWSASRASTEAAREITASERIAFTSYVLHRASLAGVEPILAAPAFEDIAIFQDRIYLSSPTGLFAYGFDGAPRERYLAGADLPPAALGAMAASRELFIATQGAGLLAFDGHRFRQILPAAASLRKVTSVLPLSTGRILIGTARGVLTYDGHALAPFRKELSAAHITALAGAEGDIWIGTLAAGVFHEHAGQLDHLAENLPDAQVLSIAVRGNAAFVGTPLGVAEFVDGRKARTLADGFFAKAVFADTRGVVVGTQDEGIAGDDGVPGPVTRILEFDGVRYALAAGGLYRREASRWRNIIGASHGVLADRNVSALAIGRGGKLWVGYFDRGLDVVEADLQNAEHFEDERLFCVNRIAGDGDRTAIATANGLVMFGQDDKPRQTLTRKQGLIADHVTDVAFRNGGMVIATPAGLSFLDAGGARSLYVFHGLVNNHVYTLGVDGDTTVAGTLGGLSILEGDRVRAGYTTANSALRHNWITALAHTGKDWLAGTYGAGVLRMDEQGRWSGFPDLREGFVVNPNAMAVTASRVYAGTLDRGLFIYERSADRWTHTEAELPSSNVTALAVGNGYLYVGTDNGVVRIAEGVLR